MRGRRGSAIGVAAVVVASATAALTALSAHAGTTADWLTGTSGNWNDPTRWSTNPSYPNNGSPTGVTYDARIAAASASPYVVTFATSSFVQPVVSVDSVTVNSANGTLRLWSGLSSDTLQALNGINVLAGNVEGYSGTIKTPLISGAAGTKLISPYSGLVLDGVTLGIDAEIQNGSSIILHNGLTMDGTHTISLKSQLAKLTFEGNQTLGGSGIVYLSSSDTEIYGAGGTTTAVIGPNINVRTPGTGFGYGQVWGNIVNQGTITADKNTTGLVEVGGNGPAFSNQGIVEAVNGGNVSVIFAPNFTQAGVIRGINATVDFDGNFKVEDIGTLQRTNATVNVIGTLDNTGRTIANDAFGGPWRLNDWGHIKGGTVTGAKGTEFLATSGARLGSPAFVPCYLDGGVTMDSDFRISSILTEVTGGLTLTGKTTTIVNSTLRFDEGGTLGPKARSCSRGASSSPPAPSTRPSRSPPTSTPIPATATELSAASTPVTTSRRSTTATLRRLTPAAPSPSPERT